MTIKSNMHQTYNNTEILYNKYMMMNLAQDRIHADKSTKFRIDDKKQTLLDVLKSMNVGSSKEITVNNQKYTLSIDQSGKIDISPASDKLVTKEMNKYDFADLATMIKSQGLWLKDGKLSTTVKNPEGKEIELGGKGRRELFAVHINNLYNMVKYIEKGKNDNMLVAMATGSGKTVTQVLYALEKWMSGEKVVITVPSKALVNQLIADARNFLPKELADEFAKGFEEQDLSKGIIVTTHEDLFMDKWQELKNDYLDKGVKINITVDEEHEAMRSELMAKRIQIAASKTPHMLLSATPTKRSFKIAGETSVAQLSMKKKQELGISKPIKLRDVDTKDKQQEFFASEKNKGKKIGSFFKSLGKRMIMGFVDSIEAQKVSMAHSYAQDLRFNLSIRPESDTYRYEIQDGKKSSPLEQRRFLRYNVIDKLGEKQLVLTNSVESMINFDLLQSNKSSIYQNGNLAQRNEVYNLFGLENQDRRIESQTSNNTQFFRENFYNNVLKDAGIINANAANIVDLNLSDSDLSSLKVKHAMIDNLLQAITGYDLHKLSMERFSNFEGLCNLVKNKIHNESPNKLLDDYIEKNGITGDLKNKLKISLQVYSEYIKPYIDQDIFKNFVENWIFDNELNNVLKFRLSNTFSDNPTVYFFRGVKDKYTDIPDGEAFSSFRMASDMIHKDGGINPKVKHQLTTVEALDNENAKLYTFTPNVKEGISETDLDNLFKMGLIANYVTNQKIFAFNDRNLHQVAYLVENEHDMMNDPANPIQGYGRNRAADPLKDPQFTVVTANGVSLSFDPSNMEKDDYFPSFFRAQNTFVKKKIIGMGESIAKHMTDWMRDNIQPDGTIDQSALEKECFELFLDHFENLYEQNEFNFEKTRDQIQTVTKHLVSSLEKTCNQINNPQQKTIAARIILTILSGLSKVCYFFITMKSRKENLKYFDDVKKKHDPNNPSADYLYAKIITSFTFEDITRDITPLQIFDSEMRKTKDKMTGAVTKMVIEGKDVKDIGNYAGKVAENFVKSKQYNKPLINMIGKFTEKELTVMFEANNGRSSHQETSLYTQKTTENLSDDQKKISAMKANRLFGYIEALKSVNTPEGYKKFIDAYLTPSEDDLKKGEVKLPIEDIHSDMEFVLKEIRNCQCYYFSINHKGAELGNYIKPEPSVIVDKIESKIDAIREDYFKKLNVISGDDYLRSNLGELEDHKKTLTGLETDLVDANDDDTKNRLKESISNCNNLIKKLKEKIANKKPMSDEARQEAENEIDKVLDKLSENKIRRVPNIGKTIGPVLGNILSRTKFLTAIYDSFNGMNEAAKASNKHLTQQLNKNVAGVFKGINSGIRGKKDGKTDAETLGQELRGLMSFTKEEIDNPENKTTNAVKRYRDERNARANKPGVSSQQK